MKHLLVWQSQGQKEKVSLPKKRYTIGRDPRNSLVIDGRHISRCHATIVCRKNGNNEGENYWIFDGNLGKKKSRNGVFVNGQKISRKELKNGDLIDLRGGIKATYYAERDDSERLIADGQNPTLVLELW